VTAVSIAQASIAPTRGSTKTDSRPAGEASARDLAFKDLLGAASDALKDDSDTLEDSAKPEDTSKPEDPPKKEQTL